MDSFTMNTTDCIGLLRQISAITENASSNKTLKKQTLLRFSDKVSGKDLKTSVADLDSAGKKGLSDVYVQCDGNKVISIFAYNKERLSQALTKLKAQGSNDVAPLLASGTFVYEHPKFRGKNLAAIEDAKEMPLANMISALQNATEPQGTGGKGQKKNKPVGSEEHKNDEEKTQGDDGSDNEDSLVEGSVFGLKPKQTKNPTETKPQDEEQTDQETPNRPGMKPQKLPPRIPPRPKLPTIQESAPHVETPPAPKPPKPKPPSPPHHP